MRIYRPLEISEVKQEIFKIESNLNTKIVRVLKSENLSRQEMAIEIHDRKSMISQSDAFNIVDRYLKLKDALDILENTNVVLYTDF